MRAKNIEVQCSACAKALLEQDMCLDCIAPALKNEEHLRWGSKTVDGMMLGSSTK